MRRVCWLIALTWALAGARAPAHGPLHVGCVRVLFGRVNVDGNISGWKKSRFVSVGPERASFGEAKDASDASFRFAVMWDAARLYLAVEVVDNSVVGAPTLARLYEGDCVEVGLDVGNDSDGSYSRSDFQFVLSPTGPGGRPRVMLYRNPSLSIRDRRFVRCASNVTKRGYVIEAAFSWAALGAVPRRGTAVGFQINIRDHDADGSVKGLTWAPASDPTANPLRWGDLILLGGVNDKVDPFVEALKAENARWQRLLDGTGRETDNEVAVEVGSASLGRLSQGVGWNVQFRDGRFPPWDEGAWAAFLELLAWTRPGWIRYGVNLGHWEPRNDDDDPSHVNWPAFAFRSKAMRHHYRVLDLCQKRGIDVLWANWRIGDRETGVKWLAESVHKAGVADTDKDPFNDAPYDPEELAESLAACIYHLKSVRNYTCVKQVSLWNEPGQAWSFNSPSAEYPAAFWGYYRVLARHLRNLGIRDAVKILGPETSTSSYTSLPWTPKYLALHSKEVDILAHHDYIGYADYHRVDRGVPLGHAAAAYAKIREQTSRPVAVTELGNMGNGASEVAGDQAVWAGSLSVCRLILEGMNAGAAGFLRWEFKPYGASWQNFGALTSLSREHLFAPYRPVFFPHALLCRAAPRGATVLATRVEGGRDENRVARVTCTALHQRDTGLAIVLVNDGFKPKSVTVRLDPKLALGATPRFGHLSYDASLPESFVKHADATAAQGRLTLTLEPRSIHALATWAAFAKVEPLPELPPRDEPKYTAVKQGGRTFHRAVMEFNVDYEWRVWQSTAGHTTFKTRPERGRDDNGVCRVAYDFVGVKKGERPEHVVAHTDLMVRGEPRGVAYRVCADGQRHSLTFLLIDAKGEIFEYPKPTRIHWEGWRRVETTIELDMKDWRHWSGDGKVDYPLRGFGFTVTAADTAFRGRGILEIDDVQLISEVPPRPPRAGEGH